VIRVSHFERNQSQGGTYITLVHMCGTLDDMAKIWWAEFSTINAERPRPSSSEAEEHN
jgi:hypothetical protein